MIILSKKVKKNVNLSITVESAIVFTLMMLLLFMNMGPMFVCKKSVDIIKTLDESSKIFCNLKSIELDNNVIKLRDSLSEKFGYDLNIGKEKEDVKEGVSNFVNATIITHRLMTKNDNNNNPFCNIKIVLPNKLDAYDDEKGIITYDYGVFFKQPLNVLDIVGIDQRFVISRRAFIGSNGNRQYFHGNATSSEAYYVARNHTKSDVYHAYKDCTYLEKLVEKVSLNEVKTKYRPCSYCLKNVDNIASMNIYITKTGNLYHVNARCPKMTAYVKTVDKKYINKYELHLCSICTNRINLEGGG